MTLPLISTLTVLWLTITGTAADFNGNVRSITQCNPPDSMSQLKNFVVGRIEGNNFEMNGTLILKDNIPGPINITCFVERCMSEDKPDSCEYHTSYRIDNFCEQLGKPRKAWSAFMDSLNMDKECPLKKGTYNIKKYVMELGILQPLTLSRPFRVFWKMTIRLDSPKYPNFFCMKSVCSLEPKKKLKRVRTK